MNEPTPLTPQTPLAPVAKPTLIIAITPRSGSTNLCSALSKTGLFGQSEEFFNPRGPYQTFTKQTGAATADEMLQRLTARAPAFAFKVAWSDWQPLAQRADKVFPHAVYAFCDRASHDAQAISFYRARFKNEWHRRQGAAPTEKKPDPPFDAAAIRQCRDLIQRERDCWLAWFAARKIEPMPLVYEEFSKDIPQTVRSLAAYAGVAFNGEVKGDYAVLRDDLTEDWLQRLQAS